MAPPTFEEINKKARDIFSKGYHFGFIKLDLKTKTEDSVDISAGGTLHQDTGKVFGSLETKYKAPDYGTTFVEKWNTENTLSTEVNCENLFADGFKIGIAAKFSPPEGKKDAKVKAQYKMDKITMNLDTDLNPSGPIMNGSVVLFHQGFQMAYQGAFDSANLRVNKSSYAIGICSKNLEMHFKMDNHGGYCSTLYQKVNDKLDIGILLSSMNLGRDATVFEIGSEYRMSADTVFRAKVDNSSRIGLSFQQKLHDGITGTLCAQIDGKNFNEAVHRVGFGLEFKA